MYEWRQKVRVSHALLCGMQADGSVLRLFDQPGHVLDDKVNALLLSVQGKVPQVVWALPLRRRGDPLWYRQVQVPRMQGCSRSSQVGTEQEGTCEHDGHLQ